MFYLAQSLAFCAFLLGIFAYLRKERSEILSTWVLSALLNTGHFLALGSIESALFAACTALRFYIAAHTRSMMALFIILALIIGLYAFVPREEDGTLAFLVASIGAIGAFQERVGLVRLLLLISTSLWAINNALLGSPIGFAMEITFLASNLMGYFRSDK